MADTPTVWVKGSGGSIIAMDLPLHPDIAYQVERGYARIVADADGNEIDEHERPTEAPGLRDTRPALNARVAEWISWAVFNGMDPEDAAAATKNDLIEKYGQIEAGTGTHAADPTVDGALVTTDPAPGSDADPDDQQVAVPPAPPVDPSGELKPVE